MLDVIACLRALEMRVRVFARDLLIPPQVSLWRRYLTTSNTVLGIQVYDTNACRADVMVSIKSHTERRQLVHNWVLLLIDGTDGLMYYRCDRLARCNSGDLDHLLGWMNHFTSGKEEVVSF
jgi:hypothetical protein